MKKILLLSALMLSTVSFAGFIYPRVITFSNTVNVSVYNNSANDVSCSGSIFIRTRSGRSQIEYYSERVYRGMQSNRTFFNRNMSDPFVMATHSIRCF